MSAGRGTVARLAALEQRERERVAQVETRKEQQSTQAVQRLAPADRAAVFELMDADPAWVARIKRVWEVVQADPLPDGDAVRAWWDAVEDSPEGAPYPAAPAGAVQYCEAEAARCDAAKREALEPGAILPDGVSLPAFEACARWAAGLWRYSGPRPR